MFSTFITVALFASLVIQGAYAGFAINNPPVVQCQSAEVSWAKATPPYQLEIMPANDPCGEAMLTVGNLNSTTFNYTARLLAGTQLVFFVSDSAGHDAWSNNVTVGSSPNNTCIPGHEITAPATTLTPATTTPAAHPTPASAGSSSTPSSGIGGALNAGLSGAPSVRQTSTPLLTMTALAAILAMIL